MHMATTILALRNSQAIKVTLNGTQEQIGSPHPILEFSVYLDGVLIGSGTGRDELDKALGALREILDAELLKELASSIIEIASSGNPCDLLAKSGRGGLMFCEAEDYDRHGEKAFIYAEDFLLERRRRPET
ncbi:hypothetical protein [Agrobacterium tumefaciens]|uniref:hypothetical protein n=1 Tax=Agrobacterium tumefaciens TaxID=358 RepID=UPI003BA2F0DC